MLKTKRGAFGFEQLSNAALGVGIFVIIVVIVANIVTQVQSTQTANSTAWNISAQGLTGIALFGSWTSIIVIVAIAVVVIGLLTVGFSQFGRS